MAKTNVDKALMMILKEGVMFGKWPLGSLKELGFMPEAGTSPIGQPGGGPPQAEQGEQSELRKHLGAGRTGNQKRPVR